MRRFRNFFRVVSCLFILTILAFAGYNIALRYLYPLKYTEYVEQYSAEYGVSSQLVLAVIKCESNFETDAVSHADAAGLMQLTEETFEDVRIMLGDSDQYTYDDYRFDAEINIKYGIKYLQYLLEVFKYDKTAAIAAYNAGMGNVRKWIGDGKNLSEEDIHFGETSDYVKKVLKAEEIYTKLTLERE